MKLYSLMYTALSSFIVRAWAQKERERERENIKGIIRVRIFDRCIAFH